MTRHLIGALLLAAANMGGVVAAPGGDNSAHSSLPPGSRVAVIAESSTGGSQVDHAVGDMLTTALRKAGVRVIERQEIGAIVKEQQLVREGIVDPATAVQAGKVLGVAYLLDVKATEFGIRDHSVGAGLAIGPLGGFQIRTSTARVALDARLLDAQTGAVVVAETSRGEQKDYGGTLVGGVIQGFPITLGGIDIRSREWSDSSLGRASRKAVDSLVKQLAGSLNSNAGSVLAVMPGEGVIVSLGSFDSIRMGDTLEVMRPVTVKDARGAVVWTEERPVGELRITELRGDRCKAVPTSADVQCQEGDSVRLRSGKSR